MVKKKNNLGPAVQPRDDSGCPCGAVDTGLRRYDGVSVAGNFILSAGLGVDRIK